MLNHELDDGLGDRIAKEYGMPANKVAEHLLELASGRIAEERPSELDISLGDDNLPPATEYNLSQHCQSSF